MGVRASEKGVTLRFLSPDGTNEVREPVAGEFAFFFSRPRPEEPGDADPIHGSQDWLTDVIVVDNPAKLSSIPPTQIGIQLTSSASKSVLVQWDVGDDQGKQVAGVTISKGHQGPGGRVFAQIVEVLPIGTVMDSKHHLWKDWVKAAQSFLAV